MATSAADPTKQDPDAGTATLERKRPHDFIFPHDASSSASAHSISRKRAKYAGKLGHQDVRDFVPVGASFSSNVVPIDEAQDSGDDESQAEMSLNAESLSDCQVSGVSEFDDTEQHRALVEGRRLLITDLPPDIKEEHLKQFFKSYSVENIRLLDRKGDNFQLDTTAQKENLSMDGESSTANPVEGVASFATNHGRRLENVTIPVNPPTHHPVGYAFVTVSTSDEADRAISQLAGNEILERKVLIQRARAEEMKTPDSGNTSVEEGESAISNRGEEGYGGDRSAKVEERLEESKTPYKVCEKISPQHAQAAPPVNWNAVNTTKIRTSLGGNVGKAKDLVDESSTTDWDGKETESRSVRDLATAVALERVKALRFRLSSMNPHDGPVSAYKLAEQELHDAEVDYNYCLYFSSDDEVFQSPPVSTVRKSMPKEKDSREYRLRLWSRVEQCMKEGTLQDLKEGKIRVGSVERLVQPSLARMTQVNGQKDLPNSTATDLKQVQVLDTQETYRKQHGYLKAFPKMKQGTQSYEKMKKRVHEAKIHLNYCKYFPVTEDYLPLVLAKKGMNELNSTKIDGKRASERRAAQIWKLVEQCTQDGNLQDLKDGRLAFRSKDVPPPHQSLSASALQPRHPQTKATDSGSKPSHGGRPKEASNGGAGATSAHVKPTPKEEEKYIERQGTSDSERGVILNLDYGHRDTESKIEDRDVQPGTKSENKDEELSLDVDEKDVKQALPALSPIDDDISASDSDTASDSESESHGSSTDSEGQTEDGDAMMQYSNSAQITGDEGGRNKRTVAFQPSHASILADLTPYDLNTQLRYFHTTKVREEVDGKTPVRCLVCAKEGHMAEMCEHLACTTCGAFNRHTTQACPNNAKCGKCREQGHDEGRCPYKLKKMQEHEIVCELCQRNGHIEEDCELIWRTSGRPWESDLMRANVRLSCYECGNSGHLGNDCPSRKPDKSMGTSTWDGHMGPVSIKSTREIKIKGKATRQDPINLDDSDDERASFYRPKISLPQPVRRGQIRIITGKRESPAFEPSRDDRMTYADRRHDSFAPMNDAYRNDEARQPYQEYRDRGRGNWRAVDGPDHAISHDDPRYNNYRPSERRSRSPRYRDHEDYAGRSSWAPPGPAARAEHHDRRPRANANVYRPMPSAAQNAWARRRL